MDSPLLGRDRLLEEVLQALREGRGAVLDGGMGVGKTRLARSVSDTLRAEGWHVEGLVSDHPRRPAFRLRRYHISFRASPQRIL